MGVDLDSKCTRPTTPFSGCKNAPLNRTNPGSTPFERAPGDEPTVDQDDPDEFRCRRHPSTPDARSLRTDRDKRHGVTTASLPRTAGGRDRGPLCNRALVGCHIGRRIGRSLIGRSLIGRSLIGWSLIGWSLIGRGLIGLDLGR
jgi:hypothetical protein